MQQFLGDPESGYLDLESHYLALAIVKTTLHENRLQHDKRQQTVPQLILKEVAGYTSKPSNLKNGI